MWILGTTQVASCMKDLAKWMLRLYRTLFVWLPPVWKWEFGSPGQQGSVPNVASVLPSRLRVRVHSQWQTALLQEVDAVLELG